MLHHGHVVRMSDRCTIRRTMRRSRRVLQRLRLSIGLAAVGGAAVAISPLLPSLYHGHLPIHGIGQAAVVISMAWLAGSAGALAWICVAHLRLPREQRHAEYEKDRALWM
jgi:hypothetical protein